MYDNATYQWLECHISVIQFNDSNVAYQWLECHINTIYQWGTRLKRDKNELLSPVFYPNPSKFPRVIAFFVTKYRFLNKNTPKTWKLEHVYIQTLGISTFWYTFSKGRVYMFFIQRYTNTSSYNIQQNLVQRITSLYNKFSYNVRRSYNIQRCTLYNG